MIVAVRKGDLESVKRLFAEGVGVKERDVYGYTPLLDAAARGSTPILHWLLTEGGSSLAEQTTDGCCALMVAACNSCFRAMQYLLEEQGALMTSRNNDGNTVWDHVFSCLKRGRNFAELPPLLKVMVMLADATPCFIASVSSQYADICRRGRQLRAQLPSYLEQQRAAVVAQCPLPAVLRSLVAAYAATTPDDMWADGLRMQALRVKRRRTEVNKGRRGGE
jgi:hypothetical protein